MVKWQQSSQFTDSWQMQWNVTIKHGYPTMTNGAIVSKIKIIKNINENINQGFLGLKQFILCSCDDGAVSS